MRKYLLYIVILWLSCTLFSCTNDDYQVYNAEQVNKMYFDRDTFTFVYVLGKIRSVIWKSRLV